MVASKAQGISSGLYAIADAGVCLRADCDLRATALALLSAHPVALQLRWKDAAAADFLALARALAPAAREVGVPLIVNDRVDIAKLSGAAGVHLGQEDLPVSVARSQLGPGALVGLSTHDLAQVEAAVAAAGMDRPDYLGFGPIYQTRTKLLADPVVGLDPEGGLAAAVARAGGLPVVAIGGIDAGRVPEVAATKAHAAAVITDLLADGITPAAVTGRARILAQKFREVQA